MKIENRDLQNNEIVWIEEMLSNIDIKYQKLIINQINNSDISRDYTPFYIFIKFLPTEGVMPISMKERVPIEMRVFRENRAPTQFLLHFINGRVHELEIFNADSSMLDSEISVSKSEVLTNF